MFVTAKTVFSLFDRKYPVKQWMHSDLLLLLMSRGGGGGVEEGVVAVS